MKQSQDQLLEAYGKLPQPVRAFLAGTKLYNLMQEFAQKYNLHIDVLSRISEATMNMLLGFMNPGEFQQELRATGIPAEAANAIMAELNEKVFMPLQDEIKNAPPEEPEAEEEAVSAPVAPAPTPRAPLPPPAVFQSAPAPIPAPAPFIPQPSAPAPMPAPMSAPMQPPIMPAPRPIAPPPAPRPPMPVINKIQNPLPPPQPAAYINPPVATPPVQNGPVAQVPPTPAAPQSPKDALHDVLKNYGVDPYREAPEA